MLNDEAEAGDFKKLSRENTEKSRNLDTKKARLHKLLYAAFYAGQNQICIVTN
ncbi:hypothetical protein L5T18_001077 [Salmonella enterica]|nr:hypothetical protein [Salmonella enterica subsp. enterica serovar Mississippi]EEB7312274.1 hypothetical protein [Salmonella enterica]EIP1021688.1 hypothetical protein [Salmonella enterica]EIR4090944.1 hypothetical protein [Salmonella enterica]EIU6172521.1 hypothetical protein [Salmonella enterica]